MSQQFQIDAISVKLAWTKLKEVSPLNRELYSESITYGDWAWTIVMKINVSLSKQINEEINE